MSKKAVTASRRGDRLAFFPLPMRSPYEHRLFVQDDIADYARQRGREAARKSHEEKAKGKAGKGKSTG
jgi:hypothetical protein